MGMVFSAFIRGLYSIRTKKANVGFAHNPRKNRYVECASLLALCEGSLLPALAFNAKPDAHHPKTGSKLPQQKRQQAAALHIYCLPGSKLMGRILVLLTMA
jgi:hypothetical protein